jgi:hypothetical protein
MAICVASIWDFTTAEMKTPKPRAPKRKSRVMTARRTTDPFMGVPKMIMPATTVTATSNSPIPRYGSSLPSTTSSRPTGVEASCSIVPRSHSRAIVRAVSIAAMIDMITATSPGTIMCRLSRDGLYHVRSSAETGSTRGRPCSTALAPNRATMAVP